MSPDDRLPPRMQRSDGFSWYRTKSFRDTLGADVVVRDQRDQPVDGSRLVCPVSDGYGCFGRISVAPVRPYQGPAKLGLSVTPCACPGRGRPVRSGQAWSDAALGDVEVPSVRQEWSGDPDKTTDKLLGRVLLAVGARRQNDLLTSDGRPARVDRARLASP